MTEPRKDKGLIALPAPGARVVVRYLMPSGQATDALGELLSVDDHTVVVQGVRGVERIAVGDIVAAKAVPPRPARRAAATASTLTVPPTKGPVMPSDHEESSHETVPDSQKQAIPEIEDDQTVAPRPEEEIADIARSEPDIHDHGEATE